ncbi:hypothetical protein [Microbacterium sp. zg.Y909]|uniref:hypothetical protein n=1 Tax=Microbacterium sp. zg.Y909 TaxID=2969413 RepID=UPI0027D7CD42|nr:hypothetical protein [Microbacterium sp. zg.Y909]
MRGETLDEQGYWTALAAGASIVEPLAAPPWSPGFGVLTDAFGVIWGIDVTGTDRVPSERMTPRPSRGTVRE